MHSRARSIKTRIETEFLFSLVDYVHYIREQDPLKQGLKPPLAPSVCDVCEDSRARSIKTRIETST